MGDEKQGWHLDPTGRHEFRWYSQGKATHLVRDGASTGEDPKGAEIAPADAVFIAPDRPTTAPPPEPPRAAPAKPARTRPRRSLALLAVAAVAVAYVGIREFRLSHEDAAGAAPQVSAPLAGGGARASAGPQQPDLDGANSLRTGDCATWRQARGALSDESTVTAVPCTLPHLVEIVGRSTATGLGSAWPGADPLGDRAAQLCTPIAAKYLGYPVDAYGRFGVSAIQPSRQGWDQGDRKLLCDVELHAPYRDGPLPSFTGRVKGADQTDVQPVGQCFDQHLPVSCTARHTDELAGHVRIPASQHTYPTEAQWNTLLADACTTLVTRYVGGALPADASSSYATVSPQQWTLGERLAGCYLTADETGNPGYLTGSHRHVPTQA